MRGEQALLTMEHISKRFPSVIALDDVQLSLNKGEIRALLGENGAGKSTLIKVLTGVEKRDSGTVRLEGKEIHPKTPQEAQLAGISTVYQEVNLCPNLTVAENIYIGREPRKGTSIDWKAVNKQSKQLLRRFDLDIDVTKTLDSYSVAVQQMVAIARAVDVSAKVLILDEPTSSLSNVEVEKLFAIPKAEAVRLADEYIKKLQIKTPSQDQLIRNLSGGNQQKVILARWLATEPDLLMLDEPTRGIDIGTKAEIQKIVMELAEEGMAMVFISSELDEMLRCCNRMVVLKDKQTVADLTGEDISEATVMNMMAGGAKNEQPA